MNEPLAQEFIEESIDVSEDLREIAVSGLLLQQMCDLIGGAFLVEQQPNNISRAIEGVYRVQITDAPAYRDDDGLVGNGARNNGVALDVLYGHFPKNFDVKLGPSELSLWLT